LDTAIAQLGTDGLLNSTQHSVPVMRLTIFCFTPLDDAFGITGNLYSQMAEFDIATNQTNYGKQLEQYFATVENARPNFTDTL
jgi:hypothetical protein